MAVKKKKKPAKVSAKQRATKPAHAPVDVLALDRAAAKALGAVDESVSSQRAVLEALDALAAACTKGHADSILAHEVHRLRAERGSAIRAFHLDRAERALSRAKLAGTPAHDEAVRALEDAIALVTFVDGESATVRTLRERLHDVKQGLSGVPRPFFARYLEHQER